MPAIRLYALMEREDDPKKCTAAKLVRFKHLTEVKDESRVPRGAVVLNPEAEKALSKEDWTAIARYGLLVLDCSWNKLSGFPKIKHGRTTARSPSFSLPTQRTSANLRG